MAMSRSEALAAKKAQAQQVIESVSNSMSEAILGIDDSDPFSVPGAPYRDGNEEGSTGFSITKEAVKTTVANPEGTRVVVAPKGSNPPYTVVPAKEEKPVPQPARATNVDGIQRLIESVFEIDIEGTWKRCLAALKSTEEPVKGVPMRKVLAGIDDRCREAHKLYCNLKLHLSQYELDIEKTRAAIRDEAQAQLQAQKDNGSRDKRITNDDVQAKMMENHPDEFKASELSLRKFRLAVEHAEHLVGCLRQKSRSLQIEIQSGARSDADD